MPLESLLGPTPQALTRSRSFFSKFSSPLSSWNRNVSDFHVDLADPYKSYFPGDVVKGTVIVTVIKAIRITHLRVCLHGHAHVFKHHINPGDGSTESASVGYGKVKKEGQYLGNGYVSLFEDESVLCGEGRLDPGIYKFEFICQFPQKGLPSSIDFERGTIGYNVTATLTRSTTIAPTLQCDRKISFLDAIDIGLLPESKPRVISLEPVSRRGKVKARLKSTSVDKVQEKLTSISRSNTELSPVEPPSENQPPLSPVPSEVSSVSAVTASTQSFQVVHRPSSTNGASTNTSEHRNSGTSTTTEPGIDATIQFPKSGALPGETISFHVHVNHVKAARGTIIATLYRQGRIDMHPPIPIVNRGKSKVEYEDVYPRSKTGLGGLNFSTGSTSSLFRKDLTQTFTPMIVNPYTLTTDVKGVVRIPEDVFPTIANVPGGMISFKYFVEVLIDTCGKLGETRLLPRLTTNPTNYSSDRYPLDPTNQLTAPWTERIIDTEQMRRTKNVVVWPYELIVGSRDTSKVTRKRTHDVAHENLDHPQDGNGMFQEVDMWQDAEYYDGEYNGYGEYDHPYGQQWRHDDQPDRYGPPPDPYIPPQPTEPVDEKTRLRQAEEFLLPSRPPDQLEGTSSQAEANMPSAPVLTDLDERYDYYQPPSQVPTTRNTAPSSRSVDTVVNASTASTAPPPAFDDMNSRPGHGEDKQELERQRLMAEASAPPQPDGGQASSSQRSAETHVPSAPNLTEDEEYNAYTLNHEHNGADHLPKYRR